MRTITKSWLLGISLIVVACSGADDAPAETPAEAPVEATNIDAGAPSAPAAPAVTTEVEPESTMPDPEVVADPAPEADAGAPADAGTDSGVKKQIPLPSSGKLHATTNTGAFCAFSVDGYAKGSSTVLDIPLYTGQHVVSCKRADGVVASEPVVITANTTSNVVLDFPVDLSNGTLVAVAVGGSCTFAVNGAAKGTSSQLKLSVPPGTYSVTCKPATGAIKSRSVIIKSGDTAMAMFKLQ